MAGERTILGILAASLLLVPTAALAQAAYDYRVINYPGAQGTQISGVNDRDIAVGIGVIVGQDAPVYPFIYDIKKGRLTDLANVAGYDSTSLVGISRSGLLVGRVSDSNNGVTSGLIRDLLGTNAVFSHPDAVRHTEARGVNSTGLVSGFRDSDQMPGVVAAVGFVYDPGTGTFTDFAPSRQTIAHGMNSKGDVVGSALYFSGLEPETPCPDLQGDAYVRQYGWLRLADGSMTYFTVNGMSTRARGINDRGQIAGFVDDPSGDDKIKGFVIKFEGAGCEALTVAVDDLLEVDGFAYTIATGITNTGTIVGTVFLDGGPDDPPQGFVAKPR